MSLLSVTELRAKGPGASLVDVATDVLQFYIDEAEGEAMGYIGKRGYETAVADGGTGWKLAIIKMVSADVLGLSRGLAPDPSGHVFLVEARKEAVAWLKAVAAGSTNLGPGSDERARTGTARVFSPVTTTTGNRGW